MFVGPLLCQPFIPQPIKVAIEGCALAQAQAGLTLL